MIIAYYTGSGGHRYLNFLTNQDYTKLGTTYFHEKDKELEYLTPEKTYKTYPIILTHCLNYDLIKNKFPLDNEVYFIIADRKASWCRKYMLKLLINCKTDNEKYNTAFNFISELNSYYENIPIKFGNAKIIDTNLDNSLFSTTMKKELSLYSCKIFEKAWDNFYK